MEVPQTRDLCAILNPYPCEGLVCVDSRLDCALHVVHKVVGGPTDQNGGNARLAPLEPGHFLTRNLLAIDDVGETNLVGSGDCQFREDSGSNQFRNTPNVPFRWHSHAHDLE